jgi:thioredoxin-dependent peroxiredoxin
LEGDLASGGSGKLTDETKISSIDIGDSLPSITLKTEKGEDVDVPGLAAERGVVLFLVPKADTRQSMILTTVIPLWRFTQTIAGSTKQAYAFRDSYLDYTSLNFDVYCLSADSPAAQAKWQAKVCFIILAPSIRYNVEFLFQKTLPYPLLSDPKRVLISALGAAEGGKTKRSHFIFEKGGKLVDKKVPVKPLDR